MSSIALLNNVEHKDLRIIGGHGPGLGSDVAWVPTFAGEFRSLQAHYPIVFRRAGDGAGAFDAIALLGFGAGENLFLVEGRWDAPVVPLLHARQPFCIGRDGDELLIQVDLDHPRASRSEGEPVFRPHGGNTELLDGVSGMLSTIHDGMQHNAGFIDALVRHELLEGFELDIEFDDGDRHRLAGFFTIHEERLAALDGAALASLHQRDYLGPIWFALASLSNLRGLIDRRNARHAASR